MASPWSAAARRRFGPRRLGAALIRFSAQRFRVESIATKRRQAAAGQSGAKSPHSKRRPSIRRYRARFCNGRQNLELSFALTQIMNDGSTLFVMNGRDDSSDNELLQQLRAGDEHAFALLYRRRHAGVYRFALQMSGSQTLAEDVTQEVFMVLIRGSELFDPNRGSLSSFLYGVARNQTLQRLRRDRLLVPLDSDNDQNGGGATSLSKPLDELARTETIESVRRAVLSLPERYREVVVLCELEEMSYAETAVVLGCAIGTVRSRLHRARLLLTEKLRPAESENEAAIKTARCFA